MKRITYANGSFITGGLIADSLLAYATELTGTRPSVSVEVPVFEADGSVITQTLLLGPASHVAVEEIVLSKPFSDISEDDESTMFPGLKLPAIGVVEKADSSEDTKKEAAEFNQAVADIDDIL